MPTLWFLNNILSRQKIKFWKEMLVGRLAYSERKIIISMTRGLFELWIEWKSTKLCLNLQKSWRFQHQDNTYFNSLPKTFLSDNLEINKNVTFFFWDISKVSIEFWKRFWHVEKSCHFLLFYSIYPFFGFLRKPFSSRLFDFFPKIISPFFR